MRLLAFRQSGVSGPTIIFTANQFRISAHFSVFLGPRHERPGPGAAGAGFSAEPPVGEIRASGEWVCPSLQSKVNIAHAPRASRDCCATAADVSATSLTTLVLFRTEPWAGLVMAHLAGAREA